MVTLKPVGCCIYCFRRSSEAGKLTNEHVLPESMNGRVILPEASCDACQKVTSRFERAFARKMYGDLRWRERFGSKRKRSKRETPRIAFVRGEAANVHPDDYPGNYLHPILPPAGLLIQRPPTISNPEFQLKIMGRPDDISKLGKNLHHEYGIAGCKLDFSTRIIFDWNAFNRTIAKIAHGLAVAKFGLFGFETWLPSMIIGDRQDFSTLIGGIIEDRAADAHVRLIKHNGDVLILVQLCLLGSRLGPYDVIAGRLLQNQAQTDQLATS